ncbi:helix-turn-helix domain-containing protein [Acidaminococcus sp.]|uniref:helix-turn-helix domain-containing protein n=1 Tax=Acidaminococcus sp. TaxID=1872103 RepID=UPI003D7ED10A
MPIQISLRAARVNAGKTIIQAAKELGIGKDTLLKWEHNPGLVNPIYQQKISEVYDFPVDCINFSPIN